jgi:hypothetical protein
LRRGSSYGDLGADAPPGAPKPGKEAAMIHARSALVSLWLCAGLATSALAQSWKEQEPEVEDMPPARPMHHELSPAFSLPTDTGFIVQVNTAANGMNIVGDAANEPSFVIDPNAPNRLAVSWRQFDSITSNFRQAGHAWSTDGGRTWHNPGVLTPGTFRSDPVLDIDPNGTMYLLDLTSDLHSWIFTSGNGGQSWTGPTGAFGGDKEWMVIDRTTGPGRGFIHQSWQVQGPTPNQQYSRSTNGAVSWSTPIADPGPTIFGINTLGPNGELYIAGINNASGAFQLDKSTNANNGAVTPSFSGIPINLGGSFTLPTGASDPNPAGLEGQVYVGVDKSGGPRNGWIYVLCTAYTGGADPEDIMFTRSTDGGATWSTPIRVNNDASAANHYQWFGTLSVAPNGRIDVIWNDTRESLAYNLSRLYYASSNDGGTTWQGNTAVSPQWDSTLGWPQQDKIGDYYSMISDNVGASVVFAATFNGEQDVYFMRINDWDCNSNGIPDSVDLTNGTLHDCNGNGIPDECERAAGIPVLCTCYANCDGSTLPPVLNILDFSCFLNRFAAGDLYANCDGSTTPPVLNVLDFACFINAFAAGCT